MNRLRTRLALPVLLLATVACASLPGAPVVATPTPLPAPTAAPPPALSPVVTDQEQTLIELYRRVNPAVVNIAVVLRGQGGDMAQGSGFLYDAEGRIVTDNHVVAGAARVDVTFADGTTQAARLLGVDPDSDLAVIQVESVPAGAQPLPLGAYIAEVIPGGPADKAGLRGAGRETEVDGLPVPVGGDVVTAVDGQPVRGFDDLLEYIALRAGVGQTVQLTVLRGRREQAMAVTLEARPRAEEVNP